MEDREVFEVTNSLVNNGLSFFLCDILFFLSLNKESMEVINGHESILRVLLKQVLDLLRGLRHGQVEPPPEAEAHSIGLFGHGYSSIPELDKGKRRFVWFGRRS